MRQVSCDGIAKLDIAKIERHLILLLIIIHKYKKEACNLEHSNWSLRIAMSAMCGGCGLPIIVGDVHSPSVAAEYGEYEVMAAGGRPVEAALPLEVHNVDRGTVLHQGQHHLGVAPLAAPVQSTLPTVVGGVGVGSMLHTANNTT